MFEKFHENAGSSQGRNGRLLSIREISALTGVPPHTLRFWEKQMPDVLLPLRTPGGQRRYDAEMTDRVRMIKLLANEKRYSLAAIRERLSVAQERAEHRPGNDNRLGAEQAVESFIDDITGLLKERLLDFLEPGGLEKAVSPGEDQAGPTPPEL